MEPKNPSLYNAFSDLFMRLIPYLAIPVPHNIDIVLKYEDRRDFLRNTSMMRSLPIALTVALIRLAYNTHRSKQDIQNSFYGHFYQLFSKKKKHLVITNAEETLISFRLEYEKLKLLEIPTVNSMDELTAYEEFMIKLIDYIEQNFFLSGECYIGDYESLVNLRKEQLTVFFRAFAGDNAIKWEEVEDKLEIQDFRICKMKQEHKKFFHERRLSTKRVEDAAQLALECVLFNPLWQVTFSKTKDGRAKLIGKSIPDNRHEFTIIGAVLVLLDMLWHLTKIIFSRIGFFLSRIGIVVFCSIVALIVVLMFGLLFVKILTSLHNP